MSSAESPIGKLNVAWLEAFVLAVDLEKRAAAAQTLQIGDGTMSKQIEKLECWYGGGPRRLLLWPNTWPPRLTEDGEKFMPKAREIVALAKAALLEAAKVEKPPVETTATELRVPPTPTRLPTA